jgi:hypothetical protein
LGNGDGGLVDFMMASFDALEHHQICELLMRLDLGAARAELEAIEREAWADGADIDLLEHSVVTAVSRTLEPEG